MGTNVLGRLEMDIDSDALQSMTVAELKDSLRKQGLALSGKKSDLVKRLGSSQSGGGASKVKGATDATLLEDNSDTATKTSAKDNSTESMMNAIELSFIQQLTREPVSTIRSLPISVLLTAVVMLVASTGGAVLLGPNILSWFAGEPDYQLIEFDDQRARSYADGLISLGHPQWTGRLSGTIEESATADYVKANLTQAGMGALIEDHDVPMFEILEEPLLSICTPGSVPGLNSLGACSNADFGREIKNYDHRMDFVLQGYSGSADIRYNENVGLIDLGNGSEESDWPSAAGAVGVIWGKGDNAGNTDLFLAAQENDLRAIILVNVKQNCGELIPDDCVPFFKGVRVAEFEAMPANIGFIMVSKSVGLEIMDMVNNQSALFSMYTNMDNEGTRTVKSVCGVIPGESEQVIIFGAHHDTVYNGPGAIDDTSGTASVLELAAQFGAIEKNHGTPAYTLQFCTWGGEEEGLWGSSSWVEKHRDDLTTNLRLYINLDMNHVDAERGNGVWMFGNNAEDMDHVRGIANRFNESYANLSEKYPISIETLDSEDMPYNSDHAPFVYELNPNDGPPYGMAAGVYGSGSSEYHTYLDDMSRFNEESLKVSGIIYGSYAYYLAWGEVPV